MGAGGYVAVSKALDLPYSLPKAPPKPSDDVVRYEERGMTLGGGLEDKLAAIAALNATQIKLDKEEKRRASAFFRLARRFSSFSLSRSSPRSFQPSALDLLLRMRCLREEFWCSLSEIL